MEEDINIIEDYLLGKKMQYESGYTYFKEFKAIENLLKRYKELEEEVESQDKTIDNLIECQTEREKYTQSIEEKLKIATAMLTKGTYPSENDENNFDKHFIPISVIQNKRNEYLDFDKKHKTYTKDGRENFTMEYFKAKALDEILDLKE